VREAQEHAQARRPIIQGAAHGSDAPQAQAFPRFPLRDGAHLRDFERIALPREEVRPVATHRQAHAAERALQRRHQPRLAGREPRPSSSTTAAASAHGHRPAEQSIRKAARHPRAATGTPKRALPNQVLQVQAGRRPLREEAAFAAAEVAARGGTQVRQRGRGSTRTAFPAGTKNAAEEATREARARGTTAAAAVCGATASGSPYRGGGVVEFT